MLNVSVKECISREFWSSHHWRCVGLRLYFGGIGEVIKIFFTSVSWFSVYFLIKLFTFKFFYSEFLFTYLLYLAKLCVSCGILVLQPGFEPTPPAVEAQRSNHRNPPGKSIV